MKKYMGLTFGSLFIASAVHAGCPGSLKSFKGGYEYSVSDSSWDRYWFGDDLVEKLSGLHFTVRTGNTIEFEATDTDGIYTFQIVGVMPRSTAKKSSYGRNSTQGYVASATKSYAIYENKTVLCTGTSF